MLAYRGSGRRIYERVSRALRISPREPEVSYRLAGIFTPNADLTRRRSNVAT